MSEIDTYVPLLVLHGLAVILNTITVVVVIVSEKLRKAQNIFTCNIALSDGVSSSLVILVMLQRLLANTGIGELYAILRAIHIVEICSTLSVAVHRFIIIRFDPFNKRNLTTGPRCIGVCLLLWIVPIATFITIDLFNTNVYVITLILPSVTLTSHCLCAVCYAVVYWTIASAARKAGLADRMLEQRITQNKKVLVTFSLVVGTNLILWMPHSTSFFISYARPDWVSGSWFKIFDNAGGCLVSLNGILNPVIYWTRLTDFRQLLNELCSPNKPKFMKDARKNYGDESSVQTQGSSITDFRDGDMSGQQNIKTISS